MPLKDDEEMAITAINMEHTMKQRLADWALLTKPRLNLLVLMATAAGFQLGSSGPINWVLLLNALWGTFLTGCGSSVLNQALEGQADARMDRTKERPLPAGRLDTRNATIMGVLLVSAGTLFLIWTTTPVTAGLGLLTVFCYIALYTPLKRKTPLNTVVGAFPGALPTLMGWSAAGSLNAKAGILFAILFLWQVPHFFAIAWLYRKDYADGGFKMWPVVDPKGKRTAWLGVLYATALLLIVWTPSALELTGWGYAIGSVLFSLVFIASSIRFALNRSDANARSLFLVSVFYLAVILTLMMIDKNGLIEKALGLS